MRKSFPNGETELYCYFSLIKDISCTVLKSKYPSLTDGHYLINPGEPDFPEFSVHCDMTGKDEIGVTEIGHDSTVKTGLK